VEDLRRVANSCRDLRDPALMAQAWDEPATPDIRPAARAGSASEPSFAVPDIHFLARKSLHGTVIRPLKPRKPHPATHGQYVTVKQCDARGPPNVGNRSTFGRQLRWRRPAVRHCQTYPESNSPTLSCIAG
jgi:hypothetical protein